LGNAAQPKTKESTMKKRLTLKKETLKSLSNSAQLTQVAGGVLKKRDPAGSPASAACNDFQVGQKRFSAVA